MTKLQFVSNLLNIINGLLEAGIDSCNVHEARCYLDALFDNFEEHEATIFQADKEERKPINETEFILELHAITGVPIDEILGFEEENHEDI